MTLALFGSLMMSFFGLAGVIQYFTMAEKVVFDQALAAPVKNLKTALSQDGPAWVKVRLEVASGSEPFEFAGQKCLWKKRSGRQVESQEIRKDGKWTVRKAWKPIREDAQTVPLRLVDDSTEVAVNNWIGIEVCQDLLQIRADSQPLAEALPESDTATGTITRNLIESFLTPGKEAWALGKFVRGKPQVYLRDRFYLTGLGPEGFAKTFLTTPDIINQIKMVFFGLGTLFGFLFFRNLLKKA